MLCYCYDIVVRDILIWLWYHLMVFRMQLLLISFTVYNTDVKFRKRFSSYIAATLKMRHYQLRKKSKICRCSMMIWCFFESYIDSIWWRIKIRFIRKMCLMCVWIDNFSLKNITGDFANSKWNRLNTIKSY